MKFLSPSLGPQYIPVYSRALYNRTTLAHPLQARYIYISEKALVEVLAGDRDLWKKETREGVEREIHDYVSGARRRALSIDESINAAERNLATP